MTPQEELRELVEKFRTRMTKTGALDDTGPAILRRIREVEGRLGRLNMRDAVLRLRTEVNCRIEHGADSNGHLEYVQTQLDRILLTRPLTMCCGANYREPGWPDTDICSQCGNHSSPIEDET